MTKTSKKVLIIALLICVVAVFAACQNYNWGPVMGQDSDAAVSGNGSLAVRQGKYLYFINGNDDTATLQKPEDNYFGEASVKGSIMKSELDADGNVVDTQVVVPKMFKTSYTSGGIYVFGDWIYYVSPTTRTDRNGVVQVSILEYFRTKTDGTETQQIAQVDGASVEYVFTPNALIYYVSGTITKVAYDNEKIGATSVVADNVTAVRFNHDSEYTPNKAGSVKDYIFFTKASEEENVSANVLYATNGGEPIKLIDEKTWGVDGKVADRENQFNIASLNVGNDADGVTLYYTKTAAAGANNTARLYGYKFTGETPSFVKENEVRLADSSVSGILHVGLDKGVAAIESSKMYLYKMVDGVQTKTEIVSFSSAPTTIKFDVATSTYYYLESSKLTRATISFDENVKSEAVIISNETINTSWLAPVIVDNKLYYIDNTYGYTFVIDMDEFVNDSNELKLVVGKIASGYVESDKTADGTIPEFMTDADKESYITNNPAPTEEE